jgi:signal transduction histidine kinase
VHFEVQHAHVRCGESQLRQVVYNLADNALKYCRAEVRPEVEILGKALGDRYEIVVRDNGMGMSPAEATQVFDPFFRAERTRARPGTGLGLSIVKRMIEAHGGTVSLDTALGRGTTFCASLPLAEAAST